MVDRGYARISLDTERSGSISKQRNQIKRHGSDIEFYVDESVSGSKIPFAERPAGARLLADLLPGDRVLVTKIDRAARNVRDLLNLVQIVEERGATIAFVEQNIDTSGAMGKFFLTVIGAIAELEAAIIGERRRDSLAAFREEGRHAVGAAPFGFESVENPGGRGLVIRPHATYGPLLRQAILKVVAGGSHKEAREALTEALLDLPDLDGEDEHPTGLSQSGFRHLLENPRLAGMTPRHSHEDHEREDGKTSKRLKIDVVMVDGVPRIDGEAALLSMVEWRQLQDSLESGRGKAWTSAPGYGAALTCSQCGERLYFAKATNTRSKSVYSCARTKHEKGSKAAGVTAAIADEYLEKTFLGEHGARPYRVSRSVEESAARLEAVAIAKTRLEAAQRHLSDAADEEAEVVAFKAVQAAKKALREAEAMPSERRIEMVETGQTVADVWEEASFEERCQMLRTVATWQVLPGHLPVELKIIPTPPKQGAGVVMSGGKATVAIV